jgi:hypothetical protein
LVPRRELYRAGGHRAIVARPSEKTGQDLATQPGSSIRTSGKIRFDELLTQQIEGKWAIESQEDFLNSIAF